MVRFLSLYIFTLSIGFYSLMGYYYLLAYLKNGNLYVASIDMKGNLHKEVKPKYICKLWRESVNLFGSPDGKYVAITHYYGDHVGIWLVETKPNSKPFKIAMGTHPSWSPDGKYLAFTRIPMGNLSQPEWTYDVCIFDLTTNHVHVLRKQGREPFWSLKGTKIALIDESHCDFNAPVLIVDAQSGKVEFQTKPICNPIEPILSPDEHYLAIHPHLSRPLSGHIIIDLKTGKIFEIEVKKGYARGPLRAWSKDGKWLLWAWRIPDPKNEGSWLREEIWLVSLDAKIKRRIGRGTKAVFSPDGKHVLWLQPRRTIYGRESDDYDLMWAPLQGTPRKRLIAKLQDFTLVGWKR